MRVPVVNILCLHHLPASLPALGITFTVVWGFCLVLGFILVFNYSLNPYPQKLTNISSWVIIYLLFFQMCGFELPLLGKHQKVLKVQAILMNALQPQLSASQVILSFWLFFSVCLSDQEAFSVWGFVLGASQDCHIDPYSRDSDITIYRVTTERGSSDGFYNCASKHRQKKKG